jgi:hypothetical protein
MNSRDFCYWLQGYFEINADGNNALSIAQVASIKRHLAMVFAHEIDPTFGDKKKQDLLDQLHANNDSIRYRC